MNRTARLAGFTLVTTAAVVLPGLSPTSAATTCSITQLTQTTGDGNWANLAPEISRDGAYVVFSSSRNITGGNADANNEIVRYQVATGDVRQITDTSVAGPFGNSQPTIDDDGDRIAWTSKQVSPQNLDGSREIFRWATGGVFSATVMITATPADVAHGAPRFDADGSTLAFLASTGDTTDVFVWEGGETEEITPGVGQASAPVLSPSGSVVQFGYDGDILGKNLDLDAVVFRYNRSSTEFTTLATPDDRDVLPGVPSDSLGLVPLVSRDDVVAGGNTDTSYEMFLHQTGVDTMRQLTATPAGGFGVSRPTMSGDGRRLVFESDRDVVAGGNTDGSSEVFLRDFGGDTTRPLQVTDGELGSGEIDVSGDGRSIVFTSRDDHTGDNADGNREVFLATCTPPPAPAVCGGAQITAFLGRGDDPTNGNDVILGTNAVDDVSALGGDDIFCGLKGGDVFRGGGGDDRGIGGPGSDQLFGNKRADRLVGGPGTDLCNGGTGGDIAIGCETVVGVP